MGQKVTFRFW